MKTLPSISPSTLEEVQSYPIHSSEESVFTDDRELSESDTFWLTLVWFSIVLLLPRESNNVKLQL